MQELVLILYGLALGFSLTVPPGPMNALIASQTATRGLRNGILTGAGAMTADMMLGVTVYAAKSLVDMHSVIKSLYLLGGAVLIILTYSMLRRGNTLPPEELKSRTYSRAVVIGITNPFQILWWLTAGIAFAYLGGMVLLAALFTAVAVWIVVFPVLISTGTRKHPGASRAVSVASAAIMLLFACYFLLSAL